MNKGQGAMEILLTYGWAILVVIIVGVVLWQMGIFNPGEYTTLENECKEACDNVSMGYKENYRYDCTCYNESCSLKDYFENENLCITKVTL